MITHNSEEGCQIMVVNIKYGRILSEKNKHHPEMTVLDVPDSILKIKNKEKFEDSLESFAYWTITKKYGAEVNYCQIYY